MKNLSVDQSQLVFLPEEQAQLKTLAQLIARAIINGRLKINHEKDSKRVVKLVSMDSTDRNNGLPGNNDHSRL